MNDLGMPAPEYSSDHTAPLPPPIGQPYGAATSQPQTPPRKRSPKHWIGYPVVALVALGIGAAGSGSADQTAPTSASPAVTITQSVPAPAAETVTQTVEATVTVAAPRAPVADASTVKAPAKAPSTVKVPDGVGMNYQDAQDLWRAAGLHVSPAEDATGANRIPVLDSNWVVLAQDLKAGSTVDVDSFITATIKKYSDS